MLKRAMMKEMKMILWFVGKLCIISSATDDTDDNDDNRKNFYTAKCSRMGRNSNHHRNQMNLLNKNQVENKNKEGVNIFHASNLIGVNY